MTPTLENPRPKPHVIPYPRRWPQTAVAGTPCRKHLVHRSFGDHRQGAAVALDGARVDAMTRIVADIANTVCKHRPRCADLEPARLRPLPRDLREDRRPMANQDLETDPASRRRGVNIRPAHRPRLRAAAVKWRPGLPTKAPNRVRRSEMERLPGVTDAFTKGLGDQGPGYAEIIAPSEVGTVCWEGPC